MALSAPELSKEQRRAIENTLARWAEVHPRPDAPIIQLADGSELTPRTIAIAVQDPDSERGQLMFRVFATGLIADDVEEPETLEQILADFTGDA